jgi:triacylglycerol lipase
MEKTVALILSSIFAITVSGYASADAQFLRSAYELGDPSGYCLDIPGFGPRMRKDAPINTHTCKYNRPGFSVDEEFEVTELQQLRMPEYDLCLSAGSFETGADVFTIDCAKENAHAWAIHANGNVTPSGNPGLCLTLGSERVYVNSSPGNLIPNSTRSISLLDCAEDREQFQAWKWSGLSEQDTPTANTLRAGMSAETAAGIKALGNEVRVQETRALYASLPRMYGDADVSVSEEIAYGPEEGQHLQVYSGVNRNNPRNAAPVILLVHGGGFSRGDLGNFRSTATHFAALGYIVVNMTYPLEPKANWPIGSQSVAAAVRWIKENATDIKGDPDNIFVLGQSAGGTHVAEFVFRPSLVDGEGPTVAGAILVSPVVGLNVENASAGETAYFGDTSNAWKDKQVLGNIERTSIPVLILTAEFDPEKFRVGTARLFHELVVDKGTTARFRQMQGHNHISYTAAIGTSDTQAAEQILDFMATAGRD